MEYTKNFDGSLNRDTVVVEFPCTAGSDSKLAKDTSAVDQLELVKQKFKKSGQTTQFPAQFITAKKNLTISKNGLAKTIKITLKAYLFYCTKITVSTKPLTRK